MISDSDIFQSLFLSVLFSHIQSQTPLEEPLVLSRALHTKLTVLVNLYIRDTLQPPLG